MKGLVLDLQCHLASVSCALNLPEDDLAGSHIQRFDHASVPANCSRIASASLGARPGLVKRSTAAWLGATSVRPPSFQVRSKTSAQV